MSGSKGSFANQLNKLANSNICDKETSRKYLNRIKLGKLTRDENSKTHFCVYFAAYDPKAREVFIGRHKKSGHWLFNGGHIDKNEVIFQTLEREINEEWGLSIHVKEIGKPELLTITEIDNPVKQTCTRHYDIWYFVKVDKNIFRPDKKKLTKEFDEIGWWSIDAAGEKTTDPATLQSLEYILHKFLD